MGRLFQLNTLRLESEHSAVHAEAVADAGQVRAADLGHQAVVAAAAANAGLRAQSVVDEFEGGLGVVVQPAHHAGVDHVRHAEAVQRRGDGLEVGATVVAEVIQHQRRIRGHLADFLALVVQHAQRVDLCAVSSFLVQRQVEEELLQLLAVGRTAVLVAQAGQLQAEPAQPDRTVATVSQRDDLSVEQRIIHADGLHAHLLQLAVAACLGALVAEERAVVVQLHRQVAAVHVVLDERAHHAGGALRAQRD